MSHAILMAVREPEGESEPVVVDTDEPGVVKFTLDDGEVLAFDARELRSSLVPLPRVRP